MTGKIPENIKAEVHFKGNIKGNVKEGKIKRKNQGISKYKCILRGISKGIAKG